MNTIKIILSFLKKVNPIISPLLVGLLAFICFNQYKANEQLQHEKIASSKRVTMATKVLDRYVDDKGGKHLVIAKETFTEAQKKTLVNSGYIDTVAQALNIANEKIKELTKTNITLAGIVKGTAVSPGLPTSIIKYTDRYTKLSYNPVDTTFDFKYDVSLIAAGYSKRSGFLNLKSDEVLDLYSEDPRVTINGVERFQLEVPDPNFGLRGQVKTQYNFRTKSITPAATLEANFRSYSVEANMFYNIKDKTWTPTLGIKKDLFHIK